MAINLNYSASASILQRFCRARDGVVRLTLEPAYFELLEKLGNPHKKLPPILHVAGTNGKGSTCAFMRAILEAAGYHVHVYTSPHLVRFHERIRVAGELIGEKELAEILGACERLSDAGKVSDFEAATAAAFVAFARHKADAVILEVGMGGRLDATNVIETSAASVIARLSYDHCKYLGDTLGAIAREKAGIMRAGVPCFVAPQPEIESISALRAVAAEANAPLRIGGIDWRIEQRSPDGFRFIDEQRTIDLPRPSLTGRHQLWNAGLAIAALSALPFPISDNAYEQGVSHTEWPARLQRIARGALADMLPPGWELWLDGGHNDSAGEVLAAQMENWRKQDARPLYLIFGMLTTKNPRTFLAGFAPYISALRTVAIPEEALSFSAGDLAVEAKAAGFKTSQPKEDLRDALAEFARQLPPGRILICGSLYLAGHVLRLNEEADNPKAARG